jgi:fibronectin-binding autotransporter adhesin
LTKTGTGTLTLDAANGYSGGTTVSAGTLAIGNSNALGTGTVLLGGGTTLQAAANGLSVGNAISLGGSATIDTQSNGLTLTNAILGIGGLTKTGTGTLTLDNANAAYTGATTVAAGTLALLNGADMSNTSLLTVNGGAIFDISGHTGGAAINALAGGGTVQLGSNGLGIINASTEFSGAIAGTGGVEIGSGTQTFSGVNTYTNATQIDQGATLALKGSGSIASSAYVAFAGVSPGGSTLDILADDVGRLGRRPVRPGRQRRGEPGRQDAHHHQWIVLQWRHPGWRDCQRHRRLAGDRCGRLAGPGRRQHLHRLDHDHGRRHAQPLGPG